MFTLLSMFCLLFHSPTYYFVPEVQLYGSASEGGDTFMEEEESLFPYTPHDTVERTFSNGGFEWAMTVGGSFVYKLNDKWECKAGMHLGYAKADIEGGLEGSDGDIVHGQEVLIDYWRGDVQLGLRYWRWAHVGFQGEMNLERGIVGSYTWKNIDGTLLGKGDVGDAGESQIFFPMKYFLKIGPDFRFFDHLEIYPWVGIGKSPVVTDDSRVYNQTTGKSYPLDTDEGFGKGKFGIELGYAL